MIQLEAREEDEEWKPSREPGWLVLEVEEEKSVYYLDAEGRYWDEISNKLMDREEDSQRDWTKSSRYAITRYTRKCPCKSVTKRHASHP